MNDELRIMGTRNVGAPFIAPSPGRGGFRLMMTGKRTPNRPRCGFTLLEIMVVIIIIGAILTIAIPRFGDVFQANIKGAMRRFSGMVKFCFHESIIKQSILRLVISPETGEYWPTILITSGNVGEFVDLTGSSVVKKKARLPQGIRFADVMTPHNILKVDREEAFITFFPTGYAERAVIHLVDDAGRFYTLIIQPLTGDVQIEEGYLDLVQLKESQGPFSGSGQSGF